MSARILPLEARWLRAWLPVNGRLRNVLTLGWVLTVVLGAGAVIAFVLSGGTTDEQDHRAQVWGTVLAALVLVPTALNWAWARSRSAPATTSTRMQVEAAADRLADRMLQEWSRQVVTRGIQIPAPVRLRWEWATPDLAMERRELNESPRLGTDPPPFPGASSGAVLSSGLVTRLHDRVYLRLRHGRLVLVGEPGAGKTGAMILLLLQALQHRARIPIGVRTDVPVPIWLTLGSWNPNEQDLRSWAAATLALDHPYLRATEFGRDVTEQLFDMGLVALFLDGFDEMPATLRRRALQRLASEAGGLRVVLTSRPAELQDAIQSGEDLPYAAIVVLQPVGPETAATYLLEGRTGAARKAWEQIAHRLRSEPNGVLTQVFTTPLALSLARAAGPEPSWILSPLIDTPKKLRDRLWDQAMVAAYPHATDRSHALTWLAWIAFQMSHVGVPTRDLAWWQIPRWLPQRRLHIFAGLATGLISGAGVGVSIGLLVGLSEGISNGIEDGLRDGLRIALESGAQIGLTLGLVRGLVRGFAFGPLGGIASGLAGGLAGGAAVSLVEICMYPDEYPPLNSDDYILQPLQQITSGLFLGLVVGLVFGLENRLRGPSATPQTTTIRRPTAQEMRFVASVGLMGGLIVTPVVGLVVAPVYATQIDLESGLKEGVLYGLTYGLVAAVTTALVIGLVANVWARPLGTSAEATPESTYRADIRTNLLFGFTSGFAVGVLFALMDGLASRIADTFLLGQTVTPWSALSSDLLIAPAAGTAVGLVVALVDVAISSLRTVETLFLLRRRRVRFLPLLEDALRRQVLRQAGAVYQFRHAELQDRLAELYHRAPAKRRGHMVPIAIDIRGAAPSIDAQP
jgi:hypothetical protein